MARIARRVDALRNPNQLAVLPNRIPGGKPIKPRVMSTRDRSPKRPAKQRSVSHAYGGCPAPGRSGGASPSTARSRFGLEPKNLVDENDGDASRDDLAVDDQHLVHCAVDAVGELG